MRQWFGGRCIWLTVRNKTRKKNLAALALRLLCAAPDVGGGNIFIYVCSFFPLHARGSGRTRCQGCCLRISDETICGFTCFPPACVIAMVTHEGLSQLLVFRAPGDGPSACLFYIRCSWWASPCRSFFCFLFISTSVRGEGAVSREGGGASRDGGVVMEIWCSTP